jgi:transposase
MKLWRSSVIKESIGKKVIGIDIGKNVHYASKMDNSGKIVYRGKAIENNRKSFEDFEKGIREEKEELLIGFEPTGHYWKSLNAFLKARGYHTVMVGTYHVKLHKELIDNTSRKTDTKDSIVIADLLRTGKYFEMLKIEGVYSELRKVTMVREKMTRELSRCRIRLITLLDEYLPEYEGCFCDVLGATSLKLLEKYGIQGLKNKTEGIKEDIRKFSKKKITEKKAEEIIGVLGQSIGHNEGIIGTERELKLWIKQIRDWKVLIDEIEEDLIKLLEQAEEWPIINTIKGVGPITAGIILGQTGCFKNYSNYKKIEKLAGLDLVEISSGKHYGLKEISTRGRDMLRYALYLIAIVAIAKNKEIKAVYTEKLAQGKNKMSAITAIMVKLLRVMFALVKTKSEYEGSKLYQIKKVSS